MIYSKWTEVLLSDLWETVFHWTTQSINIHSVKNTISKKCWKNIGDVVMFIFSLKKQTYIYKLPVLVLQQAFRFSIHICCVFEQYLLWKEKKQIKLRIENLLWSCIKSRTHVKYYMNATTNPLWPLNVTSAIVSQRVLDLSQAHLHLHFSVHL